MLKNALRLIEEYDMVPAGGLVLCAVSGGADSMCLLHFLHALGRKERFSVAAAHYNHCLRGEESDRDAAFVAQWCKAHGIVCVTGAGDVGSRAARQGTGIEETARAMRYEFFARAAGELGAGRIATAHNADDNAETVLLHLTRGSGLQGLTGIPPRRDAVVRPLLTTARQEIESYLALHGIPHVEDSTNTDTAFTRNRLRREVMPILKALNPRFTESMAATIRTLRADHDYLNARAAELAGKACWAGDDLVMDTAHIAGAPAAVAPRIVRRLLEQMGDGGVQGTSAHLSAVVALARGDDPSAMLHLPGGILVQRVYGEILFTTALDPLPSFEPVTLNRDGETVIAGSTWRALCRAVVAGKDSPKNKHTFYLNCDMINGVAQFRPRRTGDTIALPGRGSKTVKKLFIDAKVPRRERERIPVLADESDVLAVAGFGPSRRHLAKPGEPAYKIEMISTDG